MDVLLVFFYALLVAIVFAPFVYLRFFASDLDLAFETEKSELLSRRDVLLDNLKDLKIEFETGKLTESEFSTISQGIVFELEEQDRQIQSWQTRKQPEKETSQTSGKESQKFCHNCGFKIDLVGAKFCPECGTRLMQ
ncbi:hypothetical protein CH373_09005 [Leptospira perolatii]|uniref:Zinc-ribbon domain-containing protein n=1 Tax=Leptospira perolatii TaxID=2023191 RepID=A0A2M9ZNR4_9LEPT|nr:zinc ribbon domain-containing protein [Leptospira perolatii]PJZ69632.1 hypothetical protein CH360_10150 [Leptospira perolatii]PJZ73619.1 hypothetical protein CH373_09005 [Leptospira perolatii]